MGYRQLGNRQGERQVDGQAGRCAFVQVGIQVGRQASFKPAEGGLKTLVHTNLFWQHVQHTVLSTLWCALGHITKLNHM